MVAGGTECVRSGSTTASCARRKGLAIPDLRPCAWSVTTAPPQTSEPVPAVVGTAISGSAGSGICRSEARNSENVEPSSAHSRAVLAVSVTEPPPIATTAWGLASSRACVAASTTSIVGSPGALTNRVHVDARVGQGDDAGGHPRVVLFEPGIDHHQRGPRSVRGDHGPEFARHPVTEADPHRQMVGERGYGRDGHRSSALQVYRPGSMQVCRLGLSRPLSPFALGVSHLWAYLV